MEPWRNSRPLLTQGLGSPDVRAHKSLDGLQLLTVLEEYIHPTTQLLYLGLTKIIMKQIISVRLERIVLLSEHLAIIRYFGHNKFTSTMLY